MFPSILQQASLGVISNQAQSATDVPTALHRLASKPTPFAALANMF
jgi:hypothetical protein